MRKASKMTNGAGPTPIGGRALLRGGYGPAIRVFKQNAWRKQGGSAMFFDRDRDRISTGLGAVRRILVVEDEPLVAFDNEHALALAG
jgi:hypothetical protein